MPPLKIYRLFISHAWRYHADYDRIIGMLKDAKRFQLIDYSVPRHDPLPTETNKELADALREQIQQANIVIILAGMYVAHSEWIQFEIEVAKQFSKPILGVKPWGQERIPQAVQDSAVEIVGWNTDSIVNAIRRLAL